MLITTVGSGGNLNNYVVINAATNTVIPNSPGYYLVFVDTSSIAVSITLPNPAFNATVEIKDVSGTFNTNNCTVVRYGSELLEGLAASKVLRSQWGSYRFQSNGTNYYGTEAKNLVEIIYSTAGTYSLTIPAGVTSVDLYGRGGAGGGAGGGSGQGGSTAAGGCGGAGGGQGQSCSSRRVSVAVVPGTTYTITVGAGGTAGTGATPTAANAAGTGNVAGGAAGDGAATTFGALYTFKGGIRGNAPTVSAFGTPQAAVGATTTRDINPAGGGIGGSPNAAGGIGASGASTGIGDRSSSATPGTAGGASGGGGGGASGGQSAADGDAPAGANGGNAGAANADGSAGGQGGVPSNGCGGSGGGGGGGGGVKAATGSTGGAGGNGRPGSDGRLVVRWFE